MQSRMNLPIFPEPLCCDIVGNGRFDLRSHPELSVSISCADMVRRFVAAATWEIAVRADEKLNNFLFVATAGTFPTKVVLRKPPHNGYVLAIRTSGLRLEAADKAGFLTGLQSLWQIFQSRIQAPEMDVFDQPLVGRRAFQMDLARQPETAEEIIRVIRQQARYHYNEVQLYLENSIKLPVFGDAADPDGITMEDYRRIQDFAHDLGVRVVPSMNLLGHMEKILRHPRFAHLAETFHGPRNSRQAWKNDICPVLPESREFVSRIVAEICEATDSPLIVAGLDECWTLGSHPATRKMLDGNGGAGSVFADWIRFLHDEFAKHGKQMWMWEDMLFYHKDALDRIPRDIGMNIWHYQHIEEYPAYSFQNWRRIDSVAELSSRGYPFILCCGPHVDHLHSMLRFAVGYAIEGLLIVQWGGSGAVQELFHADRALCSQVLWSGRMPDATACAGAVFLCDETTARKVGEIWELAETLPSQFGGGSRRCPRFWSWPANALLVRKLDRLVELCDDLYFNHETLEVQRAFLRARFASAGADWARESAALAGRRMLQRGIRSSVILDEAVQMAVRAAETAASLPEIASRLEWRYASGIRPRAMTGNMTSLAKSCAELALELRRFRDDPSAARWPFVRVSIHVDGFAMDLCSHTLKIEAGQNNGSLSLVYTGRPSQNGQGEEFVTSIPLPDVPKFVKVTIEGFASIAITRVRIETLEGTFLPKSVVGWGGWIRDPAHLLVFDRKAAIFNPPDVLSQWLSFDPPSASWVLLEF